MEKDSWKDKVRDSDAGRLRPEVAERIVEEVGKKQGEK